MEQLICRRSEGKLQLADNIRMMRVKTTGVIDGVNATGLEEETLIIKVFRSVLRFARQYFMKRRPYIVFCI